ncbi:MAG TPA: 16S rRNA (uracil(1498)-N(3))-methyltransferase, partial [Gammaproteobacteria bacterium]|nr:16S rRNA (uracil(1498)-N(3))-methyltransferase [Gammaproteobacteria bacterium]
ARLGLAEKRRATVLLDEKHRPERESPLAIHLGLGISKGERMDFAIQKAVELGVTEITPLFSQHCVVKLDEKRIQNRLRHWQAIIISACEQCGRNRLAQLHTPLDLCRWIDMESSGIDLILAPQANQTLAQIQPAPRQLRLAIGPEGGFSDNEIEAATSGRFTAIGLGPRILRTETAVVAGLSALQTLWGDLNTV